MRQAIRNWLGIAEAQPAVPAEPGLSKAEVIGLVREAIDAALDPKYDARTEARMSFDFWSYDQLAAVRKRITGRLQEAAKSEADATARQVLASIVDREAFIDDVVARIKAKQL